MAICILTRKLVSPLRVFLHKIWNSTTVLWQTFVFFPKTAGRIEVISNFHPPPFFPTGKPSVKINWIFTFLASRTCQVVTYVKRKLLITLVRINYISVYAFQISRRDKLRLVTMDGNDILIELSHLPLSRCAVVWKYLLNNLFNVS